MTAGNQAEIVLHTDSTVRAAGFELVWRAELVSPCEAVQEVEDEEGEISLPDMETGYQLPYNCSTVLSAPGKRGAREGRGREEESEMLIFIFVFQSTSR